VAISGDSDEDEPASLPGEYGGKKRLVVMQVEIGAVRVESVDHLNT